METLTVTTAGTPRLSALHLIEDEHAVAGIRLHAMAMGRAHGLDAEAVERLGVVVTEMGGNIARHAGNGQVVLRAVGEHSTGRIEVLALDKGPGIADMSRVMRDGASLPSASGRERGLAGIRRLADLFDIYSHAGHGTAVVAHVGAPSGPLTVKDGLGVVNVPLRGEEQCGDAWAVEFLDQGAVAMIVDGLGHGPNASAAARAAMTAFRESVGRPPELMLTAMHEALHRTRGAALSIGVVDRKNRSLRFCGVGNVDGRVVTSESNRHLIPQNGIVGHSMPRAVAADSPWPAQSTLVLHSDGISSRWRVDRYPGLLARHPALLAGVLFRDFARIRDDATVLVFRDARETPA